MDAKEENRNPMLEALVLNFDYQAKSIDKNEMIDLFQLDLFKI